MTEGAKKVCMNDRGRKVQMERALESEGQIPSVVSALTPTCQLPLPLSPPRNVFRILGAPVNMADSTKESTVIEDICHKIPSF
jgi:hypothetical protein